MKILERDIQDQILHYLTMRGIFHWRQNTGAAKFEHKNGSSFVRFGAPGISDILGIYNGQMFAIEVKTPKGRVTDYQKNFLKNIEENGGIAFVARKLEDVMEVLK